MRVDVEGRDGGEIDQQSKGTPNGWRGAFMGRGAIHGPVSGTRTKQLPWTLPAARGTRGTWAAQSRFLLFVYCAFC